MNKKERSEAAKALGAAGWKKKKATFDPVRMREIALKASKAAKEKRDEAKKQASQVPKP